MLILGRISSTFLKSSCRRRGRIRTTSNFVFEAFSHRLRAVALAKKRPNRVILNNFFCCELISLPNSNTLSHLFIEIHDCERVGEYMGNPLHLLISLPLSQIFEHLPILFMYYYFPLQKTFFSVLFNKKVFYSSILSGNRFNSMNMLNQRRD